MLLIRTCSGETREDWSSIGIHGFPLGGARHYGQDMGQGLIAAARKGQGAERQLGDTWEIAAWEQDSWELATWENTLKGSD